MIDKYFEFYRKYLKVFKRSQIIGALILVIYSISNVVYPYFFKLIIDDAIANSNLHRLIIYTILMLMIIIVSIVLRYIKIIYFFKLGKKIWTCVNNVDTKSLTLTSKYHVAS